MMTSAEIKARLDADHFLIVDRAGTEFLIMQDEDGEAFHAWRTPVSERATADRSFAAHFGGGGTFDWNYTEVAEEIAAWLAIAEPPAPPAIAGLPAARGSLGLLAPMACTDSVHAFHDGCHWCACGTVPRTGSGLLEADR